MRLWQHPTAITLRLLACLLIAEAGVLGLAQAAPQQPFRGACVWDSAAAQAMFWMAELVPVGCAVMLCRTAYLAAFIPSPAGETAAIMTIGAFMVVTGGTGLVLAGMTQAGSATMLSEVVAVVATIAVASASALVFFGVHGSVFAELAKHLQREANLPKITPSAPDRTAQSTQPSLAMPKLSQERSGDEPASKRIHAQTNESASRDTKTMERLRAERDRLREQVIVARGQVELLKTPLRLGVLRSVPRQASLEDTLSERLKPQSVAGAAERASLTPARQHALARNLAEQFDADRASGELQAEAKEPDTEPQTSEQAWAESVRSVLDQEASLPGKIRAAGLHAFGFDAKRQAVVDQYGSVRQARRWLKQYEHKCKLIRAEQQAEPGTGQSPRDRAGLVRELAPMSLAAVDAAVAFARLRAIHAAEGPADGGYKPHPDPTTTDPIDAVLGGAPKSALQDPVMQRRLRWELQWRQHAGGLQGDTVRRSTQQAELMAISRPDLSFTRLHLARSTETPRHDASAVLREDGNDAARTPGLPGRATSRTPARSRASWRTLTAVASSPPPSLS
jgi:hypothetical protein